MKNIIFFAFLFSISSSFSFDLEKTCEDTSNATNSGGWTSYNSTNKAVVSKQYFSDLYYIFHRFFYVDQNLYEEIRGTKFDTWKSDPALKRAMTFIEKINIDDIYNPNLANKAIDDFTGELSDTYGNWLGQAGTLGKLYCLAEFKSAGCFDSIDRLLKWVHPKFYSNLGHYSLPVLGRKVMTSYNHLKVLKYFSKYMLTRYVERMLWSSSHDVSGGDFFGDLYSAAYYQMEGNREVSLEITWDLVAFISANHAFGYRLFPESKLYQSPQAILVMNLSSLIMSTTFYLHNSDFFHGDHVGYFYPKEVKTNCYYNKGYHFWMSAYLGRKYYLESGNSNVDAGGLASYTSGIMYELFSPSHGRGLNKIIESDVFSDHNNSIRINLVFKAMGAYYGSRVEASHRGLDIDGDYHLKKSFKSSRVVDSNIPVLGMDELGRKAEGELNKMGTGELLKLPRIYYELKERLGMHPFYNYR